MDLSFLEMIRLLFTFLFEFYNYEMLLFLAEPLFKDIKWFIFDYLSSKLGEVAKSLYLLYGIFD